MLALSILSFYRRGGKKFEPINIRLAVDFFIEKGCDKIVVIVPRNTQSAGGQIFQALYDQQILQYSPSRWIGGQLEKVNDDRLVIMEHFI